MTPLSTLELALEVLRKKQWNDCDFCHACARYDHEGHKDDCWLNGLLKELDSLKKTMVLGEGIKLTDFEQVLDVLRRARNCITAYRNLNIYGTPIREDLDLAPESIDDFISELRLRIERDALESPIGGGDVSSEPSQDYKVQTAPADTEGCGSTNEKLLRELCEVDPRWKLDYESKYEYSWRFADEPLCIELIKDTGRWDGEGDVFWWMLQELRDRWWSDDCENGFLPDQEMASLQKINECKVSNLTPRTVLTAYIAWRKSTLPTPERSEGSASHNGTSAIRSSDGEK